MTPVLAIAELIARMMHVGQVDKVGSEYIGHVERVAGAQTSDDARVVAWLHDVIEDTALTPAHLRAAGIPEPLVASVLRLTKPDGANYADYIDGLVASADPLAIAVKIADLRDNLRGEDHPRKAKYRLALERLLLSAGDGMAT